MEKCRLTRRKQLQSSSQKGFGFVSFIFLWNKGLLGDLRVPYIPRKIPTNSLSSINWQLVQGSVLGQTGFWCCWSGTSITEIAHKKRRGTGLLHFDSGWAYGGVNPCGAHEADFEKDNSWDWIYWLFTNQWSEINQRRTLYSLLSRQAYCTRRKNRS